MEIQKTLREGNDILEEDDVIGGQEQFVEENSTSSNDLIAFIETVEKYPSN